MCYICGSLLHVTMVLNLLNFRFPRGRGRCPSLGDIHILNARVHLDANVLMTWICLFLFLFFYDVCFLLTQSSHFVPPLTLFSFILLYIFICMYYSPPSPFLSPPSPSPLKSLNILRLQTRYSNLSYSCFSSFYQWNSYFSFLFSWIHITTSTAAVLLFKLAFCRLLPRSLP